MLIELIVSFHINGLSHFPVWLRISHIGGIFHLSLVRDIYGAKHSGGLFWFLRHTRTRQISALPSSALEWNAGNALSSIPEMTSTTDSGMELIVFLFSSNFWTKHVEGYVMILMF